MQQTHTYLERFVEVVKHHKRGLGTYVLPMATESHSKFVKDGYQDVSQNF